MIQTPYKSFFLLFFFFYSFLVCGQLENNNWFFGYNNGLNFSGATPTTIPGSLNTFEGCASISDASGNILFYTDGRSVYNRNNVFMTNGNNTLLGNSTTTSSAVIVPKPCSNVEFYIFTVDYIYGTNGLNYSVVNMDDNGDGTIQATELGQVQWPTINTNLAGPTGEKICAVKKANGIDFWIAATKSGTNNFYVYEITSAGVNSTPLIQPLGPTIVSSNTNGYMKFSPDGTKLVRADYNPNTRVTLFNFNNATGVISSPTSLTAGLSNIGWGDGFYGVEFSPNSQKVYFASMSINNGLGNGYIYEATISPSFTGSTLAGTIPNSGGGYSVGALQLTSETPQRILIAKDGEQSLAAITNPNVGLIANPSNLTISAVPLLNTCALGLPTFIAGTIGSNNVPSIVGQTEYCEGEAISLTGGNLVSGNYQWTGPNGFTSNQQTITIPNSTTNAAGTYTLSIVNSFCPNSSNSVQLIIHNLPTFDLGSDTIICNNQSITFNPPSFSTYTWNVPITNGVPYSPSVGNNELTLTVTDANGCVNSDTILVTVTASSLANVDAGLDQTICSGDSVFLNASMTNSNFTGNWSNNQPDSSFFIPTQSTDLIYTATDQFGCQATDTMIITVNQSPIISIDSIIYYCENELAILNASTAQPSDLISWTGSIQNNVPFIPTSQQSSYTVTATSVNGCVDSAMVNLVQAENPILNFSFTTEGTCAPVIVSIQNQVNSDVNYFWNFGTGFDTLNNSSSFEYTYWTSGNFQIESVAIDAITGCTSSTTDTTIIEIGGITPTANFTMSPNAINSSNPEIHFTNLSENGSIFTWLFGDNQTSNEENPNHLFLNPNHDYQVGLIVSNGLGCSDTIYQTLHYLEDIVYYVPNTFTPDQDEFNNEFIPVFTPGYIPNDYLFVIYNRWGEKIFETNDVLIGWDGTYKDFGLVQTGIYTWKVEFKAKETGDKVSTVGHVNLLR